MKTYLPFIAIFLLQILCIFLVPGISMGNTDSYILIALSLVFCIVFCIGTKRIGSSLNVSQSQFNAKYFGNMGLRMLLGLVIIGIYLKSSKVINKPGSIFLLCSYFIYMSFEIKIILHKLRSDSKKSQNADNAQK